MPVYPNHPNEWRAFSVEDNEQELLIGGWQVMQEWERPLMQVLARNVSGSTKSILEIGFGMGICAEEIWKIGCLNYTVIEAHPKIAQKARDWLKSMSYVGTVIEGFWEDVVDSLPDKSFDGIVFDTYPLSIQERGQNHFSFIPKAKRLLTNDGVLTYYSDETKDFRKEHLKLLLSNYKIVNLECVFGLNPPDNCEYWNEKYMIIPSVKEPY